MQHTKTPIKNGFARLGALRTERSLIVQRLVKDARIEDELSFYRNDMNQKDLDHVNSRIQKLKARMS